MVGPHRRMCRMEDSIRTLHCFTVQISCFSTEYAFDHVLTGNEFTDAHFCGAGYRISAVEARLGA